MSEPLSEKSPPASPPPSGVLLAAVKQLRPRQWVKNVLLFVALVFSGTFLDPASVWAAVVGFAAFSLLASAGYVLNDLLDVEADRRHPRKRHRPIASGALPVPVAWVLLFAVLAGGVGLSLSLSLPFLAISLAYLVTTISYSVYFKHVVILDVMMLSLCYVWRVFAGALAIDVAVSAWLFLGTAFGALFLGFNKRRAELNQVGSAAGTRKNLAEYSVAMLTEYQSIVTANVVTTYALYSVFGPTPWMTATIPFVLYFVFRYIYLIDQRGEGGAPDETILRDRGLLLTGVLYVIVAAGVMYLHQHDMLPSMFGVRGGLVL